MTETTALATRGETSPSIVGPLSNELHLYTELEAPLRRLILDPARSIGRDDIEVVGVAPIPTHALTPQRTARGTWMWASDYLQDPGLGQDGGIAVPESELQGLLALRAAGVRFDVAWIAHELPATWTPDQPLPAVVPDPKPMRDLDVGLERFVRATVDVWFRAVRALGIGLAVAAGAAASVAALGGVGLDPVILVGIRHPTEPVAVWVKIAAWDWE